MRGLRTEKEKLIRDMAAELVKSKADLGDEREIIRVLQKASFPYSLIVIWSDEAVEKARTSLVTGSS